MPTVTSGTQSIAAGAVSASVVATLPSTYRVGITAGWVTDYSVTGKTTTGFTVTFAVPAPAGGSTFDYIVIQSPVPVTDAADFDTAADVVTDVLFRMDEATDGTSDFYFAVLRAVVRAYHDLNNRHPWWWNTKYPPGAFVTTDDITTLTITVASTGTSVAGTLSAAPGGSVSILNRKIRPTGKNWIARVTTHTGGATAVTLDAVPETLAAGTKTIIFQDEYQLATDLGLFIDGLWRQDGHFTELWTMERLLMEYPDPPNAGDTPVAFARIDKRRIRLSHYPQSVKRYEYPYVLTAANIDPTDSTTELTIDQNWRWLLADAALYFGYLLKSDKRAGTAKQDYERGIEEAIRYHGRMMGGLGTRQGGRILGPYS